MASTVCAPGGGSLLAFLGCVGPSGTSGLRSRANHPCAVMPWTVSLCFGSFTNTAARRSRHSGEASGGGS
jgi:hypothetical protein